ncbi:MAG: ribbon-helix-helix protein, CopG family [Krumholzibacteria bacterium]|nr:ribbon-helix-helix protein, CopG family [Candidatus Krumholzibacteria bacterium]
MKTAISIADDLFAAADRLARRLGVSRSQLYRTALAAYLERHDEDEITARLDEVHGRTEPVTLGPALDRLQRASLPREDW